MGILVSVSSPGIVISKLVLVSHVGIVSGTCDVLVNIIGIGEAGKLIGLGEVAQRIVVGIESRIEVELLLVVECEIEVSHARTHRFPGGDETHLVESSVSKLVALLVGTVLGPEGTSGQGDVALAEKSDGSRIVTNGRDV